MLSRLVFTQRTTAAQFTSEIRPVTTDPEQSLQRLSQYLLGQGAGNYSSGISVDLNIGAVQATATLTLTGLPANNETFVLCGTTFTAKTSGATGNEFNIGVSATATATAIAAAVNASATAKVSGAITAASAAGVVTFTAKIPGTLGNALVLSEGMGNTTAVNFAGGTEGTLYTFNRL